MEKEVIFDAEKELEENLHREDFENKEVIYTAPEHDGGTDIPDEIASEEPRKTVFTDGIKPEFVLAHLCPKCYSDLKEARALTVRPKRFSLKKKTVGYISVCANCGHVSFYTNSPDELLAYLRGKPLKNKKEKRRK